MVVVVALEEDNGFPVLGVKAPVDAIGFAFHLADQILIAADVGAAGCAYLDEGEAADVGRIEIEKTLDAAEAFRDAFGVIQAIDADSEIIGLHAQLSLDAIALLAQHLRRSGAVGMESRRLLEIHTDGERPDDGVVAAPADRETLPHDARFEGAVDGLEKIVAVRLNVEPDQVRAQQAFQ